MANSNEVIFGTRVPLAGRVHWLANTALYIEIQSAVVQVVQGIK